MVQYCLILSPDCPQYLFTSAFPITVEMSAAENADAMVFVVSVKQIEIMDPTEGQDSML
jgi:hypothetical protein